MAIELKAIESAIALGLDSLLSPLDVRVYRFPETPEDYGDAGRISQLFVGLTSLRTTDRSEINPLTSNKKKSQRTYVLDFIVNIELQDLTDYDEALDILDALLTFDGYALPVEGSRPILFSQLDFDSFKDGYWRYEGELQLTIETSIEIFRPPNYADPVTATSVGVGIWTSPIVKGPPVPEDSTLDQVLTIAPRP